RPNLRLSLLTRRPLSLSSSFIFFLLLRPPPRPTLFPYTTLFRSIVRDGERSNHGSAVGGHFRGVVDRVEQARFARRSLASLVERSEEHTSELQSPYDLVCRLLLEKKKKKIIYSETLLMTICTQAD